MACRKNYPYLSFSRESGIFIKLYVNVLRSCRMMRPAIGEMFGRGMYVWAGLDR